MISITGKLPFTGFYKRDYSVMVWHRNKLVWMYLGVLPSINKALLRLGRRIEPHLPSALKIRNLPKYLTSSNVAHLSQREVTEVAALRRRRGFIFNPYKKSAS